MLLLSPRLWPKHELGRLDQISHDEFEFLSHASVGELVHVIEGLRGIWHAHLLRDDKGSTTYCQYLAQGQ